MLSLFVDEILKLSILEDIGHGDITSELIVSENCVAQANIMCKQDLVLAGMPFVKRLFQILKESYFTQSQNVEIKEFFQEGDFIKEGEVIASIHTNARLLLAGERIALNLLQRLSGIATLTREFIRQVEGYNVKILDTRKTTPGLRFMEKYAVRVGGGANHRFALYDAILIKDNHIRIAGSVKEALRKVKKRAIHQKIEIEVKNLEELKEAIDEGADIVMLDNFDLDKMREAVELAKGKVLLEVSGGVTLDNVSKIASTGVDFISSGALTHSAKAVDISMKIVEVL